MKIIEASIVPLTKINGSEALMMIQRAAKTCYKTNKDTDDIESAKKIAKQLLESGHHSMFEFYNITMKYVSNIASYKDLRTHRHSTFAVESTRWVRYDKDKLGNEIKFIKPAEIKENTPEWNFWLSAMIIAETYYMQMASYGAKPDQMSLVLPQSTAAEFVVSANIREWRHILSLRSSVAQTGQPRPCVCEIMDPTLELFHKEIPVLFDDLYEKMITNKGVNNGKIR